MYSFLNCLFISVLLFEIQLSRRGGLGSNYQEEVGWDSIIKRRWVGIQLSRGGGLGSNYQEEVGWDSIIKRWWVVIQFTYQMFVHNQSQDPEFKRHMSWSF